MLALSRCGKGDKVTKVLCRCDCGTERVVGKEALRKGRTKRCMECRRRESQTEFARVEATHAESAARHAGFGQSRARRRVEEDGQIPLLQGLVGRTCQRHHVSMRLVTENRVRRKPRKKDGGVTEKAISRVRWICPLCETERKPSFQEVKRKIISGDMPDGFRLGKNARAILSADVLTIYDAEMAKRSQDREDSKRERNRERRYLQKYGLTSQEVEEKVAAQGGICSICRNPFGEDRPMAVDHCHDSGTVRDILCRNCNSGIGYFEEDQTRLLRAMLYVKRHSGLKA